MGYNPNPSRIHVTLTLPLLLLLAVWLTIRDKLVFFNEMPTRINPIQILLNCQYAGYNPNPNRIHVTLTLPLLLALTLTLTLKPVFMVGYAG